MSPTIHLTLHAGFTGDVRFTEEGFTVRPLPQLDDVELASGDGADEPADLRIARILDRFARHTPEVHDVHAQLVSLGWVAMAPEPTKAAENDEYLRMVYTGSADRVTLYLNTRNITCANVGVRDHAAKLATADQRPNGNVCFYYDGSHSGSVKTAIFAAAELISFADRRTT